MSAHSQSAAPERVVCLAQELDEASVAIQSAVSEIYVSQRTSSSECLLQALAHLNLASTVLKHAPQIDDVSESETRLRAATPVSAEDYKATVPGIGVSAHDLRFAAEMITRSFGIVGDRLSAEEIMSATIATSEHELQAVAEALGDLNDLYHVVMAISERLSTARQVAGLLEKLLATIPPPDAGVQQGAGHG